jgi:hypothetical protein
MKKIFLLAFLLQAAFRVIAQHSQPVVCIGIEPDDSGTEQGGRIKMKIDQRLMEFGDFLPQTLFPSNLNDQLDTLRGHANAKYVFLGKLEKNNNRYTLRMNLKSIQSNSLRDLNLPLLIRVKVFTVSDTLSEEIDRWADEMMRDLTHLSNKGRIRDYIKLRLPSNLNDLEVPTKVAVEGAFRNLNILLNNDQRYKNRAFFCDQNAPFSFPFSLENSVTKNGQNVKITHELFDSGHSKMDFHTVKIQNITANSIRAKLLDSIKEVLKD